MTIRRRSKLSPAEVLNTWNVPDWSNPDNYAYVKSLSLDQLRWEFLRRDETYRDLSKKKPKPEVYALLGQFIEPTICADMRDWFRAVAP